VDAGRTETAPRALAGGSGSNVSRVVKAGPRGGQGPAAAPPADPELVLVELCRVTSLTPSIRRRRLSVRATAAWLVAQPLSVTVGTVPGGVADATAVDPFELPELLALAAPLPDADPTLPSMEVIAAIVGSTRPTSWKAWAQSKRESTS
jgi:hypothetical protein